MGKKEQESNQFLTSDIIIIAGWHFNQSSHNLQKDDKTVRLEPKTAQLLSYMAQNQGKPLSREQLLQSVWPDVIVSDEVLTNAVNKIRKAFDDDRKNPKIVETIPKVGYTLIASVAEVIDDSSKKSTSDHAAPKPENEASRKFAFILHADVVGSTKLVQINEQEAHDRIQSAFTRLAKVIETSNGEVKEVRGDALLAVFSRASDAIEAATAFQTNNSEQNKLLPGPIHPVLRIGISMGEVVIANNTITGPGVVLAQRLEQIAEDGGVVIQGAIRDAVPSRLAFQYIDLGNQTLKGFDEKIRAFNVVTGGNANQIQQPPINEKRYTANLYKKTVAISIVAVFLAIIIWQAFYSRPVDNDAALSEITKITIPNKNPSIAVLPFENLSEDLTQEFLTDGITEDIITDLSRVSSIRVISSSASGRYKGKDIIPQQVGEELTVDYILQGNIRRIGDLLRVNAQLVDTKTGFNHWAKRYDRKVSEIFAIQDEVTTSVVGAFNIDLSDYEKKGLAHVTKLNIKAYDYFQEGQRAAIEHTKESYQRAIASYLKAIDTDESYGRAYGAMAYVMAIQFRRGWTDTPRETLDRSLELAKTGVKLDNTIPQTYWSLGYVYLMRKELDKAEEAVATAIKIAPGHSDAYGLQALISNNRGDPEKAIEYARKGMDLNPFYTWDYLYNLGRAYHNLKKYDEAVDFLEQAQERNPNAITIVQHLAAAYYRAGLVDEAEWEVEEMLALNPNLTISHIRKSIPISNEKAREDFLTALKEAGLPE
jgi:adenylate cyclase